MPNYLLSLNLDDIWPIKSSLMLKAGIDNLMVSAKLAFINADLDFYWVGISNIEYVVMIPENSKNSEKGSLRNICGSFFDIPENLENSIKEAGYYVKRGFVD